MEAIHYDLQKQIGMLLLSFLYAQHITKEEASQIARHILELKLIKSQSELLQKVNEVIKEHTKLSSLKTTNVYHNLSKAAVSIDSIKSKLAKYL